MPRAVGLSTAHPRTLSGGVGPFANLCGPTPPESAASSGERDTTRSEWSAARGMTGSKGGGGGGCWGAWRDRCKRSERRGGARAPTARGSEPRTFPAKRESVRRARGAEGEVDLPRIGNRAGAKPQLGNTAAFPAEQECRRSGPRAAREKTARTLSSPGGREVGIYRCEPRSSTKQTSWRRGMKAVL